MGISDVHELVFDKFKDRKFVVVSNREPYVHDYMDGKISCSNPAGGLTAALDPVLQAIRGTWVAGGSGSADRDVVDENDCIQVPPDNPKYTLKRVWLEKELVEGYYMGFSNQVIWPLCHLVFHQPVFEKRFWLDYKFGNEKFAEACLDVVENKKAGIWIHDYHLSLCPKLIRKRKKGIKLAHFWHIPFPQPRVLETCPWAEDILSGLLSNDLIGFHTEEHKKNFISSCVEILGADGDFEKGEIELGKQTTKVGVYPISIDYESMAKKSKKRGVIKEMKKRREANHYNHIALGVDRVDYTKGIIERLKAIDRFLEKYPEYIRKFVYVELGAPSRTIIPDYRKLNEEIDRLVDEINWKYLSTPWKPIHYIRKKLSRSEVLAYYRIADVCIVSSLDDGMNLVAKEFLAAQKAEDHGILLLSRFAGAANELKEALLINPYNREEFADCIKYALEMSESEKTKRMKNLKSVVRTSNIYKWVYDFISDAF